MGELCYCYFGGLVVDGFDEFFFVVEVLVECGWSNVGSGNDFGYVDFCFLFGEKGFGDVEDLLLILFFVCVYVVLIVLCLFVG